VIFVGNIFLDFLWVSISGSVIICLILLFRLLFRQVSKALVCVFWMLAILRLLLPVQLEAKWSLQPQRTALSDWSQTQIVTHESVEQFAWDMSEEMPVVAEPGIRPDQLAGVVWGIGTAAMLSYALFSYLRLKHRVKDALWVENEIYCCPGLETAFLLGYFTPRIYLPKLDDEVRGLVLQHEKAHIKRGDNWLKLAGYLSLCLHWFNPLVWLAYALLCRDVETACDELVICHLSPQEKKAYANALLSCEKRRRFLTGCPVAFGEIDIRKRILRVLEYRKPVLWSCIVLGVCIVLVGMFFLVEPVQKYPPYYDVLVDSLGQPLSEVCPRLGITDADLTEDPATGYWARTPLIVSYCGVPLQVCLSLQTERLGGFGYIAVFDGESDEGDKAALTLCHHLWSVYETGDSNRLRDMTVQDIAQIFHSNKNTSFVGKLVESWDITETAGGRVKEYLNEIRASDQETQREEDKGERIYSLLFTATYDRLLGKKYIILRYDDVIQYGS